MTITPLTTLSLVLGYNQALENLAPSQQSGTAPSETAARPAATGEAATEPPPSGLVEDAYSPLVRQKQAEQAQLGTVNETLEQFQTLATNAMSATEKIKVALRSDIGDLAKSNSSLLSRLTATEKGLEKEVNWLNTTVDGAFATMAANFRHNTGQTKRNDVVVIKENFKAAKVKTAALKGRMHRWTSSFGEVDRQIAELERHAQKLAQPVPRQGNVAALRAHAGALGSLSALQSNLKSQVKLLTDLRDEGADINGSLTTHLETLTELYDETKAMMDSAREAVATLIEIMTAPNPGAAARSFVKEEVAARVRELLDDAGVTPKAFAKNLLKGVDKEVAAELRPKLIQAFQQRLPEVFTTGDILGG